MAAARGRNIESIYRLSPLQEGILFHTLEAARPGVYFDQYSSRLDGDLDPDTLRRCWEIVTHRHAALRTLFTWRTREQPLQIVRQRVTLPWELYDWSDLSEQEQAQRWASLLQRDREADFELEQAPLMRLTLIRLQSNGYRLLWSFHHLILDGWSMRLVLDEVFALLRCGGEERGAGLRPAPAYAEFIAWLARRDSTGDEAFWRQALQGFTAPSAPTPLLARTGVHSGRSSSEPLSRDLPQALSAQLRAFARREKLTLNTLVVAAWALVLSRYSASDDVVFGTTVSGRAIDLEAATDTVGLFINTLPLRVAVRDGDEVLGWLHGIQAQQSGQRAYEQTSLASIQRWAQLPPGTALFESIIVFENFAAREADAAGAISVTEEEYIEYSNYPLAILAVPGERLTLLAVYDPDRFAGAAVADMLQHLETVLAALGESPRLPLGRVSLCSAAEREQVVSVWNRTEAEFPRDSCVHEHIEACVRRDPDAIAVIDAAGSLSYAALDARANRLARHLRRCGVGAGMPVPIVLERNCAAAVAILAVLKAGGAYVPLDPAHPPARLAALLDDLAAAAPGGERELLVLTQAAAAEALAEGRHRLLRLDRDWHEPEHADDDLQPVTKADDLAYVMYTSGSTGMPKGVAVTHRNLVNSTWARKRYYPPGRLTYLLMSPLVTDSSVAGIFWALCEGGTLVLPPARIEQDLARLARLIEEHAVSHMLCLPSLYALLLEHAEPERLASLSTVIAAGEPCTPRVRELHAALLPHAALYNEYGPTEATVWATVAQLYPKTPARQITIGRPIANLRTYVLDTAGQPVPPGLPGELYIGGAGVARGYLNQPALSGERFPADPFSAEPDARMYRTGDLARYLPDGNLEYLGRVDNQVKIRGYRVELEEIERVLGTHPQVAEVALLLSRPDGADAAALDGDVAVLADALLAQGEKAERLLGDIESLSEDMYQRELEREMLRGDGNAVHYGGELEP